MYFNAKEERLDLAWYWYMYFNERGEVRPGLVLVHVL
jgi:hypothetical protein